MHVYTVGQTHSIHSMCHEVDRAWS